MTENIEKIDDDSFAQKTATGLVLVDFYADWCGPCRMLTPILDTLAKDLAGTLSVVKVDVDHASKTTTDFQITSVPTLILFKNGKETTRIVGLKDLESLKKIVAQA